MIRNIYISLACMLGILTLGCDNTDSPAPYTQTSTDIPTDTSYFAKGADVSWLTQMESEGVSFYDSTGIQTECMTLLKSLGMNAIRLRVWVNPEDGWCNKTDVLIKAQRAKDLGMRLMIDFHYSDSWADPGKQTKPAAWDSLSFDSLGIMLSEHTTEVLTSLKNWGITPEWVQVGNETSNGMLWDDGKASSSMSQYATLTTKGYDAVKTVFPDAKVIVHLDKGQNNVLYRWIFDGLKNNGGKWDIIGMSLYPDSSNWKNYNDSCILNIKDMVSRYNCPVMVCEVGMEYDQAATAQLFLTDLITRIKAIDNRNGLGVFYWEPQGFYGWSGYAKSAFDNTGKPTRALGAFK